MEEQDCTYSYGSPGPPCTADYLWPHVFDILENECPEEGRILDLGCGNGALTAALDARGYDVVGVDPSEEGIQQARVAHPELEVHVGSAYDDLRAEYGTFSAVVSLEVVEHVYYPQKYAKCVYELIESGGSPSFNALSWLLEKSRAFSDGKDGRAFHGSLDARPH